MYEIAVSRAHRVLRLLPVVRPGQHVAAAMLDIDPVAVSRREAVDFFRNWTTVTEIEEPHETLTVKLAARITVVPIDAEAANSGHSPDNEPRRRQPYATSIKTVSMLDLCSCSPTISPPSAS
jgi:hypothetical protein